MNVDLQIENKGTMYKPIVEDGITWETERKDSPGKLKFTVLKDELISFGEGDAVSLRVDGTDMFYGFVFSKKRDKNHLIDVTAYDQIRYLKNKDTYNYENKTASEFIQILASDFNLNTGGIEDTKFKIAHITEDNTALLDMIGTALDTTLMNTGNMYVLFDDFGKLTLKSLQNMKLDLIIDEETAENFDYSSSIDSQTYNKIKLIYENEETGKRDVYIAQDSEKMNTWGILQYFDKLNNPENGKAKADTLIKLYGSKTRSLKISNVFGDKRVRAGSVIAVKLNLGDIILNNFMMVEKCKHIFKESEHFMDLTLRGGDSID